MHEPIPMRSVFTVLEGERCVFVTGEDKLSKYID